MGKNLVFLAKFIFFFSILSGEAFSLGEVADEKIPFWKAKKEVYKKIKEEKAIIVSAQAIKENQAKKIILTSAGWVNAPLDFVYKKSIEFDQYAKILPFVEHTQFDEATKILTAKGTYLSIKADVKIKMNAEATDNGAQIKWVIIKGIFDGMQGTIFMDKVTNTQGDDATECSLKANYEGKAKIPDFLLQWGLEFVGQKMAYKMRSHMESEWQKQN